MTSYQRFVIPRGASWRDTLEVRDDDGVLVPLAGAVVVMQVRDVADAANPALIELSTTNGRISIAGTGVLQLALTAVETAALSWSHGVYDVRMTLAGQTTVLVRGEMLIDPTVTR